MNDREVALVAVEALRLGLAAVPHLFVLDGDTAVLGDAVPDTQAATAAWVGLEILIDDLVQGRDVFVERWARQLVGQARG